MFSGFSGDPHAYDSASKTGTWLGVNDVIVRLTVTGSVKAPGWRVKILISYAALSSSVYVYGLEAIVDMIVCTSHSASR
jgi:hypothetical protein